MCDGNRNPMINEAANSLKPHWKWLAGKLITIRIWQSTGGKWVAFLLPEGSCRGNVNTWCRNICQVIEFKRRIRRPESWKIWLECFIMYISMTSKQLKPAFRSETTYQWKGDYYESITSRKSGHHLSLVQSNLQKSSAGYRDRRSWAPICSKPLALADPGRSLGFFVPLSIQLENWVTKARPCWKTDAPSELSCPG